MKIRSTIVSEEFSTETTSDGRKKTVCVITAHIKINESNETRKKLIDMLIGNDKRTIVSKGVTIKADSDPDDESIAKSISRSRAKENLYPKIWKVLSNASENLIGMIPDFGTEKYKCMKYFNNEKDFQNKKINGVE